MSDVTGPIGPQSKKEYEREYQQSADLFQRALDQYHKSDNPYQRQEFKDVMDQAMQILNEAAHGLMRKELEEQNRKIAKDYQNFQKHPKDPDSLNKLSRDLDQAKRSV
ncbi:MAG: hypothetical protein KGQ49_04770 [Verrucomicrobia bacterium]|nr:hypothetical protein [Verrucomicrobiota bacterium]MBU6446692.1 hypothetical protein [Verrucomicrobiota bacterium]MDE3047666.1 hypothetical protein [Verrucomicrobiota bacterium]